MLTNAARLRVPGVLAAATAAVLAVSACSSDSSGGSSATSSDPASTAATTSGMTDLPAATTTAGTPSSTPIGAETADGAAAILTKLVTDQAAAAAVAGAAGTAQRQAVYLDKALAAAEARAKLLPSLSSTEKADLPLTPAGAVVLAVSRGPAYPRTIIGAAKTAKSGNPVLLLLQTADAATPYKIAAQATMLGGAVVGQFESAAQGSPAVAEGPLAIAPDALAQAYAASLAYPRPKATTEPFAADSFATAVVNGDKSQAGDLGRAATVKTVHTPTSVPGGLRMAPGHGALVFVTMERVDSIKETTTDALTPTTAFTILSGKSVISSSATLKWIEQVAFVVPESGLATAVGADDQMYAASGS